MKLQPLLITFICSLLVFISVVAHAGKLPPGARQALFQADKFIKDDKFSEAVQVLDKYLLNSSEKIPAEVFLFLGAAYHRNGKEFLALEIFKKGYAAYPQNSKLCLNCAILLYGQDCFKEAASMFSKSYRLSEPVAPQLLYQAGAAYYAGGDYTVCAEVMDRLLRQDGCKEEWIRLGVHSFIQSGQLGKAEKILYFLLEKNPAQAVYWEMLAKVHMDRNMYLKAATALEICYLFKAVSLEELQRLAALYRYAGANLRAAIVSERACGAELESGQALSTASLYVTAGRNSEALRVLGRVEAGEMLLEKARIYYAARDFSKAGDLLIGIIGKNAANPEAHFYSALCAWEQRDWGLALREFSAIGNDNDYGYYAQNSLSALKNLGSFEPLPKGNQ